MSENVVWMIGDKETGNILDLERDYFRKEIAFFSFFPSRRLAENYRKREMGDEKGRYFTIIEAEVVEYRDNILVVAYENLTENPPL